MDSKKVTLSGGAKVGEGWVSETASLYLAPRAWCVSSDPLQHVFKPSEVNVQTFLKCLCGRIKGEAVFFSLNITRRPVKRKPTHLRKWKLNAPVWPSRASTLYPTTTLGDGVSPRPAEANKGSNRYSTHFACKRVLNKWNHHCEERKRVKKERKRESSREGKKKKNRKRRRDGVGWRSGRRMKEWELECAR